jgi:hypothetical protein
MKRARVYPKVSDGVDNEINNNNDDDDDDDDDDDNNNNNNKQALRSNTKCYGSKIQ